MYLRKYKIYVNNLPCYKRHPILCYNRHDSMKFAFFSVFLFLMFILHYFTSIKSSNNHNPYVLTLSAVYKITHISGYLYKLPRVASDYHILGKIQKMANIPIKNFQYSSDSSANSIFYKTCLA